MTKPKVIKKAVEIVESVGVTLPVPVDIQLKVFHDLFAKYKAQGRVDDMLVCLEQIAQLEKEQNENA
jgi:hypothetical protein